jgi:hypothetical protein
VAISCNRKSIAPLMLELALANLMAVCLETACLKCDQDTSSHNTSASWGAHHSQ